MSKALDALRKREKELERELAEDTTEARLRAVRREISDAQAAEAAALDAERQAMLEDARARREIAELAAVEATQTLADALDALGMVEDEMRSLGGGVDARSRALPVDLRQAVRHAGTWWRNWRPAVIGLEAKASESPLEQAKRHLAYLHTLAETEAYRTEDNLHMALARYIQDAEDNVSTLEGNPPSERELARRRRALADKVAREQGGRQT